MIEFAKIKLVIWDLDETLWKGVLSEGSVVMPKEHIQLVKDMVDSGVMCSICSKNDEQPVLDELENKGLRGLFVFNSINWSPKGERVKQIVTEMNLRQPNVVFIDDNPSNRGEVKTSCPDIDVEDVDIIPELISYFRTIEKKDIEHKRLKQYNVLEEKQSFKANFASNEEFLKQSNVVVELFTDCMNHKERILDLINRSNQLNFTKIRLQESELDELLSDTNIKCGYAQVRDNFGDYGIVGFYAVENGVAKHFVFSCRTLGMGVEQFVYKQIGEPMLNIQGDVSSSPYEPNPYWINQDSNDVKEKDHLNAGKVLVKGPCDMQQMFAYIADGGGIFTEFVYVNDRGVSIESANHTCHIVQSLTLDAATKERLAKELPFGDEKMYDTIAFDEDVDFIVLSLFTDPNLGLYKERKTGAIVAFGEYVNNLTDVTQWPDFIDNKVFTANCNFSQDFLNDFTERFEYLGRISQEAIIENLNIIFSHIQPRAHLILVIGSETEYLKNTKDAYADRHIYNRKLNKLVRDWAKSKSERVHLIDVNNYIDGQESFTNNINHFVRIVYYKMSNDVVRIINENRQIKLAKNSKLKVIIDDYYNRVVNKLKKIF